MSKFILSAFAISSWRFQIYQLGDLSAHFVSHNRVVIYYRYDRVYKSGLFQLEGFVYPLFSSSLQSPSLPLALFLLLSFSSFFVTFTGLQSPS